MVFPPVLLCLFDGQEIRKPGDLKDLHDGLVRGYDLHAALAFHGLLCKEQQPQTGGGNVLQLLKVDSSFTPSRTVSSTERSSGAVVVSKYPSGAMVRALQFLFCSMFMDISPFKMLYSLIRSTVLPRRNIRYGPCHIKYRRILLYHDNYTSVCPKNIQRKGALFSIFPNRAKERSANLL